MASRSSHSSLRSSSSSGPSMALWLCLAFVVLLLDQGSKALIINNLQLGQSRTISEYFSVVRWHNTGAAFSFLAGSSGWQRWFFIGLGVSASAFIMYLLKQYSAQKLFCFAIAMILGGAIGNVIDRVWHSYVIDFILLHYRGWHFPAFNLADSAITLGAICLISDELRRVRRG